jgi:FtsH-binding integral membrane protein
MNPTAINTAVAGSLSKIVSVIVVPIVELVFALAIVFFVWGAAGLILNKDNGEKHAQSWKHIMWGLIGMVIMVSCYGIIRIIAATIGVASPV